MLARILSDPTDDSARLVYADRLSEQGDPRGEFIALQMQGSKTPAAEKQERALLQKHAIEWLGPLASVVEKAGLKYERGFLSACRVNRKKLDALQPLIGHRLWATVEEIEAPSVLALDPSMRCLRRWFLDQSDVVALSRLNETRPFRALAVLDYRGTVSLEESNRDMQTLSACRANLPELEELGLDDRWGDPLEIVFESELFEQIQTLQLRCWNQYVGDWHRGFRESHVKRLRLQHAWSGDLWRFTFSGPELADLHGSYIHIPFREGDHRNLAPGDLHDPAVWLRDAIKSLDPAEIHSVRVELRTALRLGKKANLRWSLRDLKKVLRKFSGPIELPEEW